MAQLINPDNIQVGDDVVIADMGGVRHNGTVIDRRGIRITVDCSGNTLVLNLAGKRSPYQVVAHKPWLPA